MHSNKHFQPTERKNQKMTNQKLGELWNSFGMQQGNLNLQSWVGKVGAAKVKHEDYKGESKAKIAFFLNKEKPQNVHRIKRAEWDVFVSNYFHSNQMNICITTPPIAVAIRSLSLNVPCVNRSITSFAKPQANAITKANEDIDGTHMAAIAATNIPAMK